MYEYWGTVERVHDGDTITVSIDQGFNTWRLKQHLRIAGISARELSMPGGPEAFHHLRILLLPVVALKIRSYKVDHDPADLMSFDRYVVSVALPDGKDLAHYLISVGYACPWDGKTKPTPYPTWPIPVTS